MLMLMVPATVGLVVLAAPIVRLIFERGVFTPADTQATALALVCYAPAIIGYSAVRLVVPSFYALGTSLTPALVSVGSVGLNIVLNLVLVRVMGYQGLALGTAIAALSNATLLLALLRRRLDGLEGARIADSFARITVAAAVMGAGRVADQPVARGILARDRVVDTAAGRGQRYRRGSGGPGRRGAVAWYRRVQPGLGPGRRALHAPDLVDLWEVRRRRSRRALWYDR